MARILILDDEASYRDYLSSLLARANHEVRAAGTVAECLEQCRCFKPHLLVADYILKEEEDGLSAIGKAQDGDAEMHAILMSGSPPTLSELSSLPASVDGVIEKPFSITDLLDMVDQLLVNEMR